MTKIFADTFYFLALLNPPWARDDAGDCTTASWYQGLDNRTSSVLYWSHLNYRDVEETQWAL